MPDDVAMAERIEVPAGTGRAVRLAAGDAVAVVAVAGPQVGDLWAFAADDPTERLSTEHTRSCLCRLAPRVGEAFWSNRRRPMLTVIADSSPGDHDLLLSACDEERYRLLGHDGPHRTCAGNLREAMAALGLRVDGVPSPVNLFERVVAGPDGTLEIAPPSVEAGQSVTLRAETALTLAVSACPMDIVPTNGADRRPKPLALLVERGAPRPNQNRETSP